MLISIFLLLILIVYLIYHYYVQYGPIGRLINNIPGPSGYPIIGNTLQLLISRGKLKFLIHFDQLILKNEIIIIKYFK